MKKPIGLLVCEIAILAAGRFSYFDSASQSYIARVLIVFGCRRQFLISFAVGLKVSFCLLDAVFLIIVCQG